MANVLVPVGDHRASAVPPLAPDDMHLCGEEGVRRSDDRADVEVVLPVLDRDVESVPAREMLHVASLKTELRPAEKAIAPPRQAAEKVADKPITTAKPPAAKPPAAKTPAAKAPPAKTAKAAPPKAKPVVAQRKPAASDPLAPIDSPAKPSKLASSASAKDSGSKQ